MITKQNNRSLQRLLPLLALLGLLLTLTLSLRVAESAEPDEASQGDGEAVAQSVASGHTIYIPYVGGEQWDSPLGIEPRTSHVGSRLNHSKTLALGWVRLQNRVRWRQLQPTEGGPIDWSKLENFERELRAIQAAGLTPIVTVQDFPEWATTYKISCSAIKAEKFGAFAEFMAQLVNRYKTPEFNVHHWELGNEPDVDPRLHTANPNADNLPYYEYGCWGNWELPNYGGEHYGNMLKVVTPRIRQADPRAKVMIGGLLLARPQADPQKDKGHPENFLRGILAAGAAPYFDIVAYHGHSNYYGVYTDLSGPEVGDWTAYGGSALGKPRFLRQVMAEFGVSKPVFLNESTLTCNPQQYDFCRQDDDEFWKEFRQLQAAHLPRVAVRSLHEGVMGFNWFTLEGPGWYNSALLDENQQPLPVYHAYRNLSYRIFGADGPPQAVTYTPKLETYRFTVRGKYVDVSWARKAGEQGTIVIPESKFIAAYDQVGTSITPSRSPDGSYLINVGFNTIYIERLP